MLAALGPQADPTAYISRRKKMAAVLTAANIEFTMPAGNVTVTADFKPSGKSKKSQNCIIFTYGKENC